MDSPLDTFRSFIINNLRDKQIEHFKGLLDGKWRAKKVQELQSQLSKFSREDKKVLANLVDNMLTATMHDLLSAIQENNNLDNTVKVIVDGQNITDVSDGLQGEIFGDDGWIERFSRYKSILD